MPRLTGKQLTPEQDARFPNDGFPFQIELLGFKVTPPDHYGMGGCTDEVWAAIYQNRGDSTREIVYHGFTLKECQQWVRGE